MNGPHIAGSFICVRDMQGMRHALRLSSVTGISDHDIDQTETLIIVNGGRASILVPYSMESILNEIVEADPMPARHARFAFSR